MPKITALSAITSVADDDVMPIVDDSASTTKKITLTKLKEYFQALTAWVTNTMISFPSITATNLGAMGATASTGTNSGTLGGTYSYMRIGNLMIIRGTSATQTTNTGATVKSIVYPVTFGAIPTVVAIPKDNTVSGSMLCYEEAGTPSTTGVSITVNNTGGNGTCKVDYIVIGTM